VPVPRLRAAAGEGGESVGVLLRLTGEAKRCRPGGPLRLIPVESEVALYLPALFPQQEREEEASPEPARYPGTEPRSG
jgi:hypothetical protein